MKLLWIEAEALKICADKPNLAVEEVVIFEEFGTWCDVVIVNTCNSARSDWFCWENDINHNILSECNLLSLFWNFQRKMIFQSPPIQLSDDKVNWTRSMSALSHMQCMHSPGKEEHINIDYSLFSHICRNMSITGSIILIKCFSFLLRFSLAAAGFVMTYYKFRGPVSRNVRRKIATSATK